MLSRLLNAYRLLLRSAEWRRNISMAVADAEKARILADIRARMPDSPTLSGYRVYSQSDEDGIIAEIFRRIGGGETFVEIGCGDGLENNTHLLLLNGWRGVWVDGSPDSIMSIRKHLPQSKRLEVRDMFVTAENIAGIAQPTDFLSIDIDGNDLYILGRFVALHPPKVICTEYNASFPPPISVGITYNPEHRWASDNYHGASLQAIVDSLPGYTLVACSLGGMNAFFVRNDLAEPFTKYAPAQIYLPLRFHLFWNRTDHPPSYAFLREKFHQDARITSTT